MGNIFLGGEPLPPPGKMAAEHSIAPIQSAAIVANKIIFLFIYISFRKHSVGWFQLLQGITLQSNRPVNYLDGIRKVALNSDA